MASDNATIIPAVAGADPTQFRKENCAVFLIEFESMREAETASLSALLETRIFCTLVKAVGEGLIQVLERMLQSLRRRRPEPGKFVSPLGNKGCHFNLTNEPVSCFVICILQGQRLVVDKSARAGRPAHIALLPFAGHQLVFWRPEAVASLSPSADIYQIGCAIDPALGQWQAACACFR